MSSNARKYAVILNAGSGTGQAEAASQKIEQQLRAAGAEVAVTLASDGPAMSKAVSQAVSQRVTAIVAGGGDGTVNAVASELLGKDIPLGVVPLGTLNHFARDLKLPLEIEPAVELVLAGRTMRVDVGEVNGHFFLNNSSLGLYPAIVRLREQRPAKGLMKWAVAAWATIKALRHNMILSVDVEVEGKRLTRQTPIVFVGNNEYKMAGFEAGTRESLSNGLLAVYVVNTVGRLGQLKLAWRVFTGTAEEADALDVIRTAATTIRSRRRALHVSFDGEIGLLESPYEYRIRPAALEVLVAEVVRPDLA